MRVREFPGLLKESYQEFSKDNALRLSAALSYYTVFSLGPLLILVTAVAGMAFGDEAVRGEISNQLKGFLGSAGAEAVEGLVAGARKPSSGVIATIVALVILFVGATGVFAELKAALNEIWETEPRKTSGVIAFIKDRMLSFAMVVSIGFLLLVSLILNAALAAVSKYVSGVFPAPSILFQAGYMIISFLMVTVLFGLLFKVLPEAEISWRDVWVGAAITAVFFSIGKFLIGLYLGTSSVASTYGASASIVVVMLWAYYSSTIVFFGAEFTEVYSRRFGSRSKGTGSLLAPKEGEKRLRSAS